MWSMTRAFATAHNGTRPSRQNHGRTIRLPVVGRVSIPAPDQIAFYGVLGGLALLEVIEWPVAVAMGVSSAVLSRHVSDVEAREDKLEAALSAGKTPAKKTAPHKESTHRTPARH